MLKIIGVVDSIPDGRAFNVEFLSLEVMLHFSCEVVLSIHSLAWENISAMTFHTILRFPVISLPQMILIVGLHHQALFSVKA